MLTSNMNGWSATSEIRDRTTTEGIQKEIFGIPVKSLNYCFYASSKLTDIKDLPNTVESCVGTFEGCISIKNIDKLPSSIIDARRMFAYCENLKNISLPSKLKYTDEMFYYCLSLEGDINIPDTIETHSNMFKKTTKKITLKGDKTLNDKIKGSSFNITVNN